jgi:D-sedoheptulose 7-phosphate isomerase
MADSSLILQAFKRHADAVSLTQTGLLPQIEQGAELVRETLVAGKTILTCGNGGSAADAQHFAAEWVCKYKDERRPYRAIALSTDTSIITAIANDFSFDTVFARQVEALGEEGDLLVAFTTSGGSKNVLAAIEAAHAKKMKVIVLTGKKGVGLADAAHGIDCVIAVPTEETARIQEMHGLIYHVWCEYFDSK